MRVAAPIVTTSMLLLALAGCEDQAACEGGLVRDSEGRCVASPMDGGPTTDSGARDGGDEDAGEDADGGPCGACPTDRPICRTSGAPTCVECTADEPCTTGVCETGSGTCVDCVDDAHCTDPDVPTCTGNTCQSGCSDGACAARFATQPQCDETSGRCGECTPDTERTACTNDRACDPDALTCTGSMFDSLGFCRPCFSDNECGTDGSSGAAYRCVPTTFGASMDPAGTFCLLDHTHLIALEGAGTPCPPGTLSTGLPRTSVGGTASNYCVPREMRTTCTAILDHLESMGCGAASQCGDERYDDGLCEPSVCTYPCVTANDCPGTCVGAPSGHCT